MLLLNVTNTLSRHGFYTSRRLYIVTNDFQTEYTVTFLRFHTHE